MPETFSSTLSEYRACIHCGYNLRGLVRDGNCPECGRPIADSLRGNFLEHVDPQWLEKLRFGCALKLWDVLFLLATGIGAMFLSSFGLPQLVHAAFHLFRLAASAFGVWASFTITTPEPRVASKEGSISLRKAIRACAIVGFIGALVRYIAAGPSLLDDIAFFLRWAWMVAIYGELVYFRRLALRTPDVDVADGAKNVLRGALVVVVGLLLVSVVQQSFGLGLQGSPGSGTIVASSGFADTVLTVTRGVLGLYGLILFVNYLWLLSRLRKMFAGVAIRSRELAIQSVVAPNSL